MPGYFHSFTLTTLLYRHHQGGCGIKQDHIPSGPKVTPFQDIHNGPGIELRCAALDFLQRTPFKSKILRSYQVFTNPLASDFSNPGFPQK